MAGRIYLDYNATAPVRPQAREVMTDVLCRVGNPSSIHAEGRAARAVMERARAAVAGLIAARPSEILFTSGGSEANNLALRGSGRSAILLSAGEHASVLEAVEGAQLIPLDSDGRVDCAALADMLSAEARPALVSVQLANNETGVIQPIERVVEVARAAGALVHCDAIQAAGKRPLNVGALDVDLLSLSAHKLGGPAGVGALWLRGGLDLSPMLRGGGQERRRRAGTENLPGIAGFGAAAQAAADDLERMAGLAAWRDDLEAALLAAEPEARVFGRNVQRLPSTSCLASPRLSAELQLMALDLEGFAVSSGSACSSGKVGPSHVLAAMGVPERLAQNALRISFGWASEETELHAFAAAWIALHRRRAERGSPSTAEVVA
ncbi:cysteine desulfurase family protein [Aquibaculum arenosum]|uniref:Cysteine desulfurase n=1 Tax=Aquibaculum arenosum TaxID=3032591 RepID=A0ABT5YM71_9PROT|nr:cysteine desulfurase family protein [Fodinicurvata sp. CAU 1616]MDF2095992.1 cysteine desulfurase family protein [Fodinicurvata sp. CAU 1616]